MGRIDTCKWCGKQFDDDNARRSTGDINGGYCSLKCKNAAQHARREQDAVRQREREARKQRLAEIEAEGGFQAKLLKIWRIIKWTFFIVVGLLFLIAIIKGNK